MIAPERYLHIIQKTCMQSIKIAPETSKSLQKNFNKTKNTCKIAPETSWYNFRNSYDLANFTMKKPEADPGESWVSPRLLHGKVGFFSNRK